MTKANNQSTTVVHNALTETLKNLGALTEHTGEQVQHTMMAASAALIQAATTLLEEAKKQSAEIAMGAQREIKEHPVATAASVVVASAAIIGLLSTLHARHEREEREEEAGGTADEGGHAKKGKHKKAA